LVFALVQFSGPLKYQYELLEGLLFLGACSFIALRVEELVVRAQLTDAQMKVYFGWTGESDTPARYVHLSGRDVDDALLRINGIKPEAQEMTASPTAPKACPRCKHTNSPVARFCMQCSSPLDTRIALEIEQRTSKAEEITSRVIEAIIQKAPDLVSVILREQGLIKDIQEVAGTQGW
jgi:hypothetical protein